jgi:hypothetical protein
MSNPIIPFFSFADGGLRIQIQVKHNESTAIQKLNQEVISAVEAILKDHESLTAFRSISQQIAALTKEREIFRNDLEALRHQRKSIELSAPKDMATKLQKLDEGIALASKSLQDVERQIAVLTPHLATH